MIFCNDNVEKGKCWGVNNDNVEKGKGRGVNK